MSSTSRAAKRARVAEPAAAPPAVGAAAAAMSTFDALPDAVVSSVFKSLGPGVSWPLRSVCRRWRRVIEETEWPSLKLRTDKKRPGHEESDEGSDGDLAEGGAGSAPSRHGAATALVEKRKLRLDDGASVSLGAGWREVEAACGLLAALVRGGGRSGSGAAAAQPRELAFRVRGSEEGDEEDGYGEDFLRRLQKTSSEDEEDGYGRRPRIRGRGRRGSFVVGALGALRPPGGAPSRLEGLHLCLFGTLFKMDMHLPPGDELRAALSPFGKLRSLTLCFTRGDGVTPEAAAAVAAACPLLRSLSFRPDFASESAALAALAPLAHLERLALFGLASGAGFGAIADGPAGRSLRSLFFLDEDAVGESDAFPRMSDIDVPRLDDLANAQLSEAAVCALARLPRLERMGGFALETMSLEAVRVFGGAAGLRELSLRLCKDGDSAASAAALAALGEALSALPSLSTVKMKYLAEDSRPEVVAAFLSSAGARRSLTELELDLWRQLSEAEAEAIAALPALRRLFLRPCHNKSSKNLRPYEILTPTLQPYDLLNPALLPYEILGRLGPEVAIKVADVFDMSRAAIDELLAAAGRRPYT
eukprot:tig00000076_g2453.t1